jgi:uncharacterized membrane protein
VTAAPMKSQQTEEQRRRIRRTTIVLALVALGIYVAFIASGVMKAQP